MLFTTTFTTFAEYYCDVLDTSHHLKTIENHCQEYNKLYKLCRVYYQRCYRY